MLVNVCKAAALRDEPVDDAHIAIEGQLPHDFGSLAEAAEFYRTQAKAIAGALKSLPQGTRYHLLLQLLEEAPGFYRGS